MKTAVIVNPAAGGGRGKGRWSDVHERFLSVLGDFDLLYTGSIGHGVDLAREALINGAERLIAVGGDGTWHEIVEGCVGLDPAIRGDVALGFFPTGSGCDFARHMNFPKDADALLAMLNAGNTKLVDVVRASFDTAAGRRTVHMTNMAAFGLGGDVAHLLARTGKPFGGRATYFLATAGILAATKPKKYEIILDGNILEETELYSAILANTSSTGGGMLIAPDADNRDGLFELITFGAMPAWELIKKLPLLYSGRHLTQPGVTLRQGKTMRVRVLSGETAWLNIDGEAAGSLPAEFEILPKAVPVIVP